MKTILIDDEMNSLEIMEYDLKQLNENIEVVAACTNPVEGLKAINNLKPELIMLDIEMPNLNGFELLDLLPNLDHYKIIFVTAYNQYAIKAFQYLAIDYLLKPVTKEALSMAINLAKRTSRRLDKNELDILKSSVSSHERNTEMLVVSTSDGYKQMKIKDIVRCQSTSNYTEIYLKDEPKILISKTLKYFDEMLVPMGFLRVHQSHLIQADCIDSYHKNDGGFIKMKDGATISVSRAKKNFVQDYFKHLSINQ